MSTICQRIGLFTPSLLAYLPTHRLSDCVYRLTRIENRLIKNLLIKVFIKKYQVDLTSAEIENPEDFRSFNEFFTRKLKSYARPIDQSPCRLTSPVDGRVSQFGEIYTNLLLQAKNKDYTLDQLLVNNKSLIEQFINGRFITLYLSPKDYHRIHAPYGATIVKSIYVPGDLFAVNEGSVATVDNLFARNERVINVFETEHGQFALIMVGAVFVGSMQTVWTSGLGRNCRPRVISEEKFLEDSKLDVNKGDEIGRFNMGSTVILLFPEGKISFVDKISLGASLKMGESLADFVQR